MMNRAKERRNQWITSQLEAVRNNPGYSPEQVARIEKRLNRFSEMMEREPREWKSSLPDKEDSLIKSNAERLMNLLHPSP